MTTFKSSSFDAGLFRKHYFVASQLKHLTAKTASLGLSKMWSTNVVPSRLTEIIGYLSRFKLLKVNKQNCLNV